MVYVFRIKSTFIQFLLFFCFLTPFAYLLKTYANNLNEILDLILLSLIGIGCYLLASFMTKGKAEIKLSDNEIEFLWLKRPIITTQTNQIIKITDIDSWKYRQERYYNYFIIHSKKSENMILYRDSTWDDEKDDFGSFLKKFKTLIDNHNNGVFSTGESEVTNLKINSSKAKIIDEEDEFYKSRFSSFLFYLYILTIIFGVVGLIIKWDSLSISQTFFIISGILSCFFLINRHKRMKNK